MSLTEKLRSHPIPLFQSHPKKVNRSCSSSARPFENLFIGRLRSLLPVPGTPATPIPLVWLSRAAGVLSLTITDAGALISDPSLLGSDSAALSDHLDASLALLDACNGASAEIDRLLRARLHVRFAIHLLRLPLAPESVRKARAAISDWEALPRRRFRSLALSSGDPSRGNISAVRRAIHAVEAVSSLVASSIVAALGSGCVPLIRVAGDLPWSDLFNEIAVAVSGRVAAGPAGEVAAMELKVRGLAAAIEGVEEPVSEEAAERIRSAVEETEKATEEMTEALERLSDAVNGTFRAALATRNAALQSFRLSPSSAKKNSCDNIKI